MATTTSRMILSGFTRRPVVNFNEVSRRRTRYPLWPMIAFRSAIPSIRSLRPSCVCDVSLVCSDPRVASTPQKFISSVLVYMRMLRSFFGLDICLLRYALWWRGQAWGWAFRRAALSKLPPLALRYWNHAHCPTSWPGAPSSGGGLVLEAHRVIDCCGCFCVILRIVF